MVAIRRPLLSPIRFYDPNLTFDNDTNFQNPDNRVSTGYNWENVNPISYALPIPKQWPDGQPGIDFVMNTGGTSSSETFYAKLYDADDAEYKDLYVSTWLNIDSGHQWHVWLDGESGAGIADGYYTIKLFAVTDDALLLESEALLIADWFDDMIPFEFWNFENDFGYVFDNAASMITGRVMIPVRLFDPGPTFEKEMYKNDPGVLTTLRTIAQRVFNFDSHPIPVHVAELFQMAFSCSELYLDRIKINSDEAPESEIIEGTNLKQVSGKATLVNFNDDYVREKVDTAFVDENIDWLNGTYGGMVITGNSVSINDAVVSGVLYVQSDAYAHADEEVVLVKIVLTDDGTSDLPLYSFDGGTVRVLEWGTNWFSFRANAASSDNFRLWHLNGERAVFTAVITFYSIS